MSEFTLYENLIEQYEKIVCSENEKSEQSTSNCSHLDVIIEKGMSVCRDCGEEVQNNIEYDKEWRYYGQSDTKYNSDPNRVQIRKNEERNIYKDVESLGFSETIVSKANKIYS